MAAIMPSSGRGQIWAVSEAGARHNRLVSPFFPVIFRLDIDRLALPY
jgi:hypothetical protein